jgi:hypothetical protein
LRQLLLAHEIALQLRILLDVSLARKDGEIIRRSALLQKKFQQNQSS